MTFRLFSTALIALGVALTGCASHNWTPGPQATGDFGVVSGRCKLEAAKTPIPTSTHLLSDQNGGYFATSGVGLSGILASSIQKQDIYNACMEANGFIVADAAQPAGYSSSPGPIAPQPHSKNSGGDVIEVNVYDAAVFGLSGRLICECPNCAVPASELNERITSLNANALPKMKEQYGNRQGLELYQKQLQQVMTLLGIGPCRGA